MVIVLYNIFIGKLTPQYNYIANLRIVQESNKVHPHYQEKKALKQVASFFAFRITGHLFDTGAINKILDAVEQWYSDSCH